MDVMTKRKKWSFNNGLADHIEVLWGYLVKSGGGLKKINTLRGHLIK